MDVGDAFVSIREIYEMLIRVRMFGRITKTYMKTKLKCINSFNLHQTFLPQIVTQRIFWSNLQQDGQSTIHINWILRRGHVAPISADKAVNTKYSEPFLSTMQRACATLYCYLCPVWLYIILSTLSHKSYDFRKRVIELKCVIWHSAQPCLKHFLLYEGNSISKLQIQVAT